MGCNLKDSDTLIGIGSTILNKTKIGKNCIIGANTLIPENKVIPDRSLVLGSPGKVIRQITDKEVEEIKENAKHYVENYKKYKIYIKNACFEKKTRQKTKLTNGKLVF